MPWVNSKEVSKKLTDTRDCQLRERCFEYRIQVNWKAQEGKRPLGRPRHRWQDNIRMDLEEIDINAGNWVDLAQDRNYWRALVNEALNLRIP